MIPAPRAPGPLASDTAGVPIRRFEGRASTMMVTEALKVAGYQLKARQHQMFDVLPLRPGLKRYLRIKLAELMGIVDRLRADVGLEPIVKRR